MWCASVTHRLFRGSHVLILVFLFSLNKAISKQVKQRYFGYLWSWILVFGIDITSLFMLLLRATIAFDNKFWADPLIYCCFRFDITIKIFSFFMKWSPLRSRFSFLQYYRSSARHWIWWRMMERFLGIMNDDDDDTFSGSNMKFYSFIWGHSRPAHILFHLIVFLVF